MLNILWVIMIAGGIFFAAFHGTMGQITESFISSSTEAVNLCIFMLGVIGVWNGMMEIAVKSGLMKKIAKTMYPFIHWLFPDIPPRHKANEYIAANMAANILGLGWAATPAGLKAMRELQKLEEGGGRASDMMCAFLVLNISSLQLVPINMIAYRSQYGSVNPAAVVLPAICATMISTIAGIVFIKIIEITRYNGKKYNRKNKKKRRWIQSSFFFIFRILSCHLPGSILLYMASLIAPMYMKAF